MSVDKVPFTVVHEGMNFVVTYGGLTALYVQDELRKKALQSNTRRELSESFAKHLNAGFEAWFREHFNPEYKLGDNPITSMSEGRKVKKLVVQQTEKPES